MHIFLVFRRKSIEKIKIPLRARVEIAGGASLIWVVMLSEGAAGSNQLFDVCGDFLAPAEFGGDLHFPVILGTLLNRGLGAEETIWRAAEVGGARWILYQIERRNPQYSVEFGGAPKLQKKS